MSPGTLSLGGRRGRPAEPRGQHAEEEGEEAAGEVLREAHEARAADDREDAGQGQGVPGDREGDRPGAVDRGPARSRGTGSSPRRGRATASRRPTPGRWRPRARAWGRGRGAATAAATAGRSAARGRTARVLQRPHGAARGRRGAPGGQARHRRDRALRRLEARRDTGGALARPLARADRGDEAGTWGCRPRRYTGGWAPATPR